MSLPYNDNLPHGVKDPGEEDKRNTCTKCSGEKKILASDFEEFENDLEQFPLPICFDPKEELKQLNKRTRNLVDLWNETAPQNRMITCDQCKGEGLIDEPADKEPNDL